jgi:hypothetical protein
MNEFLTQIRGTLNYKLYYPALYVCLTIPDICGALESENGKATPKKYIKWFNSHLGPKYAPSFDGENCWNFRCAMLHQGKSVHRRGTYNRVIFTEPEISGISVHNCIFKVSSSVEVYCLDIKKFCQDMISGCEIWYNKMKDDNTFKKNYENFIKPYPGGISPFIHAKVVIG